MGYVTSLAEVRLDALKQIKLTTVTMTKMIAMKATMTVIIVKMTKTKIKTKKTKTTTTITIRLKYLTPNKPLKRSVIPHTTASKKSREHFSKWIGLSTTFK